jgi:hypothetical protein
MEVMISMVLLAFISLAIYQATTSSFRLRERLLGGGDFQNAIRLSLGILDRDFAAVYSPLLMLSSTRLNPNSSTGGSSPDSGEDQMRNDLRISEELSSGELSRSTRFWGGAIELTGLRPTRFQGTAQSMSFISASHIRIYKEAPETELTAITYALDFDKMPGALEGTQVLMRTSDPAIFSVDLGERESKSARTFPLIRGVSKLEFKYWHPEKKEWMRSWDTESNDTKNVYPSMLLITLEVKGAQDRLYEGKWTLKMEMPLRGLSSTF